MAYCSMADVQAIIPEVVVGSALEGKGNVLSLVYLSGGVVLAGTDPGGRMLRSTDCGATWIDVGQLGTAESILSLTYLDGVVLAGTSPGGKIYRSINYGLTWSDIGQLGAEEYINALVSFGEEITLAGTSPGGKIYRSADGGATWIDRGQLGSETSIYSLVHISSSVVLAGTSPGGKIYRSINYGLTWSDIGQLGAEEAVLSLHRVSGNNVVAGTSPGGKTFDSANGGATWIESGQVGNAEKVLSLGCASPGGMLAGTYPAGLIYQNGATGVWKAVELTGQDQINAIIYVPRKEDYQTRDGSGPDRTVIVGTGAGAKIFRLIALRTGTGLFYNLRGMEQGIAVYSTTEVESFIAAADDEINTYCYERYTTQIPFDPVPGIIKWISIRLVAAELWMAIRRTDPEATYEYLYAKQLQLRGVAIGKLMEIASGMVDIYGADVDYSIPMFGTVDSDSVFDDIGGAVREA